MEGGGLYGIGGDEQVWGGALEFNRCATYMIACCDEYEVLCMLSMCPFSRFMGITDGGVGTAAENDFF
ncbi:hypothetical protein AA106556_0544 [Neokomagataea tanensis NBRC 106556]|uniref:Uncharacterized protein n=1 Tax=Neokomagataea tanensis NBRC 106556 TaxID=1223519 RepID=A0ABQ0QHC5_9PROT|nr:hypothetical protein AA106556_0544 [Neokomagataea tanensis NBRC 106556]